MEEFKSSPNESFFFDLSPDEVTLFFYILGVTIAKPLTINELNLIGNGLFITGEVLIVIAAQQTLLNDALKAKQEEESSNKTKSEQESEKTTKEQIQQMQNQIQQLQDQIQQLKDQIRKNEKK